MIPFALLVALIDAGERAPMAVVVTSPPGSNVDVSAWLGEAAAAFERRARVEALSSERSGVDPGDLESCPARDRLECWIARAAPSGARFLLVISILPIDRERQRVGAYFFDLGERSHARMEPIEVGAAERRSAAEKIFEAASPSLAYAELLGAPGAIAIAGEVGGTVQLDDRALGEVPSDRRIDHVAPGIRRLRITTSEGELDLTAQVESGRTATVSLAMAPPSIAPTIRIAVIASGGAIAATGIALVIAGIVRASIGPRIACIGDVGVDCPRAGSPSFGYDSNAGPATSIGAVEPGGVRMAPLGGALFAAGAAWSLGALFFGEQEDALWVSLVVGVVASAAVYGGFALAGGT
jgi:hypothetical protein